MTAAIARRAGLAPPALELELAQAQLRADAGDVDAALAMIDGAATEADAVGATLTAVWASAIRAWVTLRRSPPEATALIDASLAACRAAGYATGIAANLRSLAFCRLLAGDLGGATDALESLRDHLLSQQSLSTLRMLVDTAATLAHRAAHPAWPSLSATVDTLPPATLLAAGGYALVPLPASVAGPLSARDCLQTVASLVADLRARPPAPEAAATATHPVRMHRSGGVWTIAFAGTEVSVRTSKGLDTLAELLAAPTRELHCLDLMDASVEQGSTGEVIDATSRRRYEERIRELQAEIDAAEADHDFARGERAQVEFDALVDHLTAAMGHVGKARRAGDTVERARSAVTHRVRPRSGSWRRSTSRWPGTCSGRSRPGSTAPTSPNTPPPGTFAAERSHVVRPLLTPIGMTPPSRAAPDRRRRHAHPCPARRGPPVPDRRRSGDHPRLPRRHRPAGFRRVPAARDGRGPGRVAWLLRALPAPRHPRPGGHGDRHTHVAGQPRLGRTPWLRRDPARGAQPSRRRIRRVAGRGAPRRDRSDQRRDRAPRRRLRGRRHHERVRSSRLPRPAGPGVRRGRRPHDQRDHHDLRGRGDRRHPRGHGGERAGRDLPDRRDRRQAALGAGARRRDHADRRGHRRRTGLLHAQLRTPQPLRTQLDVAAGWTTRIKGVRANASRRSHEELDAATELDRGDIAELAQLYAALQTGLDLRVVGGCCGTDDEHIGAIAAAVGLVEDTR